MFAKFFPLESAARAEEFGRAAGEVAVPLSAAQVQGYFMWFKHSPQEALDNVWRFRPPQ